jgi:lysozyme family protein
MATVPLTEALRREYENLFNTCTLRPERMAEVDGLLASLRGNESRYRKASKDMGIPWGFVAVIHNMEAGLDFTRHLHNGDPLTHRTVQVPAGRPKSGSPPFSWEESAMDALSLKKLGPQINWSLAGTLYQLERYNGWGYRLYHPHVLSPYLWGFSSHYKSGKYVADGTWSDTAVSRQCGSAVLLRRMAEKGMVEFLDQPAPRVNTRPLVAGFSAKKSRDSALVQRAEDLQRWLNTFPGLFVKVDGVPGNLTSEAYQKVTGHYLPGDPRG